MSGRFVRLAEEQRPEVTLFVDGQPVKALEGDTLMTGLLNATAMLRESEFGDGSRAGFCMMGACQDCWVWTESGDRLRACSTTVSEGLKISTKQPEATWSNLS